MNSDSLVASRIAGQTTPVSGVKFTAMWRTFKQEFLGGDDATLGELRSYRRLADGDGR
ncbi:hypothetical protein SAMN04487949_3818 [Halogranum gelatinilyticum]|uniref:Uncharacterized protein n=1 Tax=Halogranum gelatinilyticum TaxID=660521 RepID=A0A1H0A3K4_9EURY|nr:hypothetical protein [Halogranum gelatinilyticum]SDN28100.1 hypothetical protein SAMN04487949_3818 [Halogranum gelatinilyticum]